MNDLIFYAILIALLYYFFIYLSQKKLNNQPSNQSFPTVHKETQTITKNEEPGSVSCPGPESVLDEKDLEKEADNLLKEIKEFSENLE